MTSDSVCPPQGKGNIEKMVLNFNSIKEFIEMLSTPAHIKDRAGVYLVSNAANSSIYSDRVLTAESSFYFKKVIL